MFLLPTGMGFDCPTPDEQQTMIAALKRGDLAMQAFPHNSETSTFSPDLFRQAIQVSHDKVILNCLDLCPHVS